MKASELKKLSNEQILEEKGKVQAELLEATFQLSAQTLSNTARLKELRRDVARINTELRRREVAEGLPKASLVAKPVQAKRQDTPTGGKFLAGLVDEASASS